MATVSGRLLARYTSPLTLTSSLLARYSSGQGMSGRLYARYSTSGLVQGRLKARYRSPRLLTGRLQASYWAKPGEVSVGGGSYASEVDVAWQTGVGTLEITQLAAVTASGTHSLIGVPSVLQITENESAALQWQLTILDDTGYYHPRRTDSPWAGVMDDRAFDSSGAIAKTLEARIKWGGHEYALSGAPNKAGHTRSFVSGNRFDFSWGGTDVPSARLFWPHQTLPTIRSSRGSILTNDGVLRDFLPSYVSDLNIKIHEARIRTMHRNDLRAGDALQAILDLTGAAWRVRGRRLECYQPALTSPQWTYGADAYILEDQLELDSSQIVNQVVCRRAIERGASQRDEPTALNDFGVETETFSPPISGLTWKSTGAGIVSDVICRDASGNVTSVLNPRGGVYASHLLGAFPINVASVEFTWGAPTGVVASGAPGTIQWFGAQQDATETLDDPGFDEEIYVEESDSASIDAYGTRRVELSPNPLLWDSAAARYQAQQYLLRKAWDSDPQSFRVHLNLAMRVGHTVDIEDDVLQRTDRRYITQVTHSISDDPGQRFTRFRAITIGGPL